MGNDQHCNECQNYKQQGHNFCRMCGNHLTKGYVPYARLAAAYQVGESFCGYCGGPKRQCDCVND
jgi:hypothetical protein